MTRLRNMIHRICCEQFHGGNYFLSAVAEQLLEELSQI